MSSFLKNRRGIALLLTLTITTVLIAATLELNRQVRTTVIATATTRDRLLLSQIASSGIHLGMAMLIKDRYGSNADSVQEDWADPEKISELLQEFPFEEGSVTFKISDELGKIQANALIEKFPGHRLNDLQYNMWDNLLRPIVSKDEDADINATASIIGSLKDWLDSKDDDATEFSGAETAYYETLDPPYTCRNGPIPHIDELLMVKGMTPEILYGTGEAPDETSGLKEMLGTEETPSGITSYLTVYGMKKTRPSRKNRKNKTFQYEGKININTADLPVLKVLTGPDHEDCAQAMYDYREEQEEGSDTKTYVNALSGTGWYRNISGCGDVKINSKLLTNKSDTFRIESAATLHDAKMTITAVVQRERDKKTRKWKCRVLNWQEE